MLPNRKDGVIVQPVSALVPLRVLKSKNEL